MLAESSLSGNRLAVLIDADNANAKLIEPLLKEISKFGTATVKRIYGDWTSPQLNSWKNKLNEFAILPMQQFGYTTGKNSTDSALIIDAMDLLYTEKFDGFCIVSSDSDFTRLASRIRESGLSVYGFGEQKTPGSFVAACDKFIYTEILEPLEKEKENNSLSTANFENSKTFKSNRKLVKLLKDAYEAKAGEDGWANLGLLGNQLNQLSSSFDPRNFGYKKLGELFRNIDLFEVKEIPHKKNPLAKELLVKLK
ncbi:MAG: NYN domain-containing protein [Symploca sp. SIO2B6]|nr:NYN domain-containing protein [Symploca sp. SIO2B6]